MARAVSFPSIKPTGRSYAPGEFPQSVFEAQNGATTVVRFGARRVNSQLKLSFENITDVEALSILKNYENVNQKWDYIQFTNNDGAASARALYAYIKESGGSGLRWRYSKAPSVISVKPGIVSVECEFTGFLDGV